MIAAQKLLFEAKSLQEPYNNSLYRAWVKDVNFDALFALEAGEDPTHSILSSNHVEAISKKHLTDRYASPLPPTKDRHVAAAEAIHLGLALANLNGLDYSRPIKTGGEFCYTRYQDEMVREFSINNAADDTTIPWDIVRNAAVACGAFPFAFRTKELVRHLNEYGDPATCPPQDIPSSSFPSEARTFTYTDGGTFQNEPLGLAKNLVDKLDPTHAYHDNRFYLFVSPSARTGTSNSQFNEKLADYANTAGTIAESIFNQARFHDWIRAEEINDKIRLFDERARGLFNAIKDNEINSTSLQPASAALLPLLFANRPNAETLQQAQQRLKIQFQDEYSILSAIDQASADNWIDAILTFETAADIGDKDIMQIFGITATEDELAGSKLEGFIGFFDQKYRDHDYDVGRTKAREFIHNSASLGLIFSNYPALGAPIPPSQPWMNIRSIDHSLDGLELAQVSEDMRKSFRDRLSDRADDFLSEIGIPWAGREAIDLFLIKPKLNKLLGLS